MADENIFSGLKVVDLASFIAGPGAATILSDYGADVIKVEPPGSGDPHRHTFQLPPQPRSKDNYAWHLDNRNKRGMSLDLKSPHARPVLERLIKWADVLVVARTGLLSLTRDSGAPPTLPPSGSGDHATAVGLYGAIVTALYRRERTGKGGYVTTSLLAQGVWSGSMYVQAALAGANFYPLHDRKNPPNAIFNVYSTSDDQWFLIVVQNKDWPSLAAVIGRQELLLDARFNDDAKRVANAAALTEILDKVFASQTLDRWRHAFDQAHITYGVVRSPQEVTTDPQLLANDVIVPLEGAGEHLKLTVSSPLTVHGAEKVPARRAPELGEHNDEILKQLGFSGDEIDGLRAHGGSPGLCGERRSRPRRALARSRGLFLRGKRPRRLSEKSPWSRRQSAIPLDQCLHRL